MLQSKSSEVTYSVQDVAKQAATAGEDRRDGAHHLDGGAVGRKEGEERKDLGGFHRLAGMT